MSCNSAMGHNIVTLSAMAALVMTTAVLRLLQQTTAVLAIVALSLHYNKINMKLSTRQTLALRTTDSARLSGRKFAHLIR